MKFPSFTSLLKADSLSLSGESSDLDSIWLPEKSFREWGVALLLFVFSFLYLWPFRNYSTLNADEGIVLQGAQRILQGEVLYRDFFSFLTPGSYYWVALLFKIFGSSILVGRTMLLLYGGLFSVLTYFLARRVCSRWSAILAAYLSLITCLPHRFLVLHNWDSTLWAFLALYGAVWLLQAPHWTWAFGSGCFIALTFLCEQSKGAGLMLGLLLGLLIIVRHHPCGHLWRGPYLLALLAGMTWPFVLTLGYFGSHHCLSQMLAGWFWPLQHYSAVNRLPYGYLTLSGDGWEAFYGASWVRRLFVILVTSPWFIVPILPFLALGLMAFHAIEVLGKKQTGKTSSYYVLVCAALLGLVLAAWATGRPDFTHLIYVGPPLFLVLAWLAEVRGVRSRLLAKLQPLVVVYLLVFFTAFGLVLLLNPLNAHERLATRRGLLKTPDSDPALQVVQELVPSGEKIFVYPYQPLYYYLTATFSPTRYEYLQPGMHTPAQFRDAINQLAADQTRVVLFDLSFGGEKIPIAWPATPPEVLITDPGRDFIFSHYRPCRTLASSNWRFVFMLRKDLTCASNAGLR